MSQTILIVDDFASVRLYHMSFLKRKGYECVGAAGGTEALAVLAQQHVDLVLLDMVMPGMDGTAFLARLDADPRHARLAVLAITSEEALAQSAANAGARPFGILPKPVMPDALLQHVQRLLAASAPPAPAAPAAVPPA